MWTVFWTIANFLNDPNSRDHFLLVETEEEAAKHFAEVAGDDRTLCAGYAPIRAATEPQWENEEMFYD